MITGADGRIVRTVRGPIDPADLGVTLAHEHLWMDSTPLLAVHGYRSSMGWLGLRASPRARRAGHA
jgi:predicted metal-dependent phosphotriesterase family hydrolase